MVPRKITASFTTKDAEKIEQASKDLDRSMSSVLRMAVRKFINEYEERNNSRSAMRDTIRPTETKQGG